MTSAAVDVLIAVAMTSLVRNAILQSRMSSVNRWPHLKAEATTRKRKSIFKPRPTTHRASDYRNKHINLCVSLEQRRPVTHILLSHGGYRFFRALY
jgi:hypothetical protein